MSLLGGRDKQYLLHVMTKDNKGRKGSKISNFEMKSFMEDPPEYNSYVAITLGSSFYG